LVHDAGGRTQWFTFSGLRANLELAARLVPLRDQGCTGESEPFSRVRL
jgi:hypothetical protein